MVMVLTGSDRAKLADLVRRAGETPLDMRDFGDPAKIPLIARTTEQLSLQIGTLVIAVSHDRMPPDWRLYRHLSVSDRAQPADDQTFSTIADAVGMGDPETWNADLPQFIERNIERMLGTKLNARHAFRPLSD